MGTKGDQARNRIIDTAIMLYSKHGYDQTSFQMIAKELNITHTAPIYHFKNKLGLFTAVVNRIFARADDIILGTIDPADTADSRLVKYFQGHMTWTYIYKREADVFSLLSYFACINDDFAELYKQITLTKRSQIFKILESGKESGVLKFDMASEIQAIILLDFLVGMLLFRLAGRKEVRPIEEINFRIKETIQSLLKGA